VRTEEITSATLAEMALRKAGIRAADISATRIVAKKKKEAMSASFPNPSNVNLDAQYPRLEPPKAIISAI